MDNTAKLLEKLFTRDYFGEFTIIDGVSQHPEGLTYKEWMKQKNNIEVNV